MTNNDYFMDEPSDVELIRKRRLKEKELDEAFRDVLRTGAGIEVLRWILEASGVMGAFPSLDSGKLAYFEGRRSLGLLILQKCGAYGVYDRLLAKPVTEERNNV